MSSATHSPGYVVSLVSRSEVAVRTLAFEITRPEGFQFKAGQTADLTWINPAETDQEGNTRTFSIASAPDEPQLLFATRLRDTAFKRALERAPLGTALRVEGPFGNLTLHNNTSRPAILILLPSDRAANRQSVAAAVACNLLPIADSIEAWCCRSAGRSRTTTWWIGFGAARLDYTKC